MESRHRLFSRAATRCEYCQGGVSRLIATPPGRCDTREESESGLAGWGVLTGGMGWHARQVGGVMEGDRTASLVQCDRVLVKLYGMQKCLTTD